MHHGDAPNLRGGRMLALTAILFLSLNLRTAVAGVSPIAGRIAEDIPLSTSALSLVGMMPPIAFGVFALLAPMLAKRLGLEASVVLALSVMATGHLLRAFSPGLPFFLVTSLLVLAGMGVGNVLLPPLIKRYFPQRIGLLTAITGIMLTISTALPSLLAAPVADHFDWRVSLGSWALLAAIALMPWLFMARRAKIFDAGVLAAQDLAPELAEPLPPVGGRVRHSRIAWALALIFAAASCSAYAVFAWLPQMLMDVAGVSEVSAGALLSLYGAMGFVGNLAAPALLRRGVEASTLVYLGIVFFFVGYLGLLIAPVGLAWLWVFFCGLGPLLFTVCLVLVATRSRTEPGSVRLSTFMLSIGYGVGALGPIMVGLLHELTGGWVASILFLMAVLVVAALAARWLRGDTMLEDTWHRTRLR